MDAMDVQPGFAALRGDYRSIRPDYTVAQDMAAYTPAEHALWRRLHARQVALLPRFAAPEFLAGMAQLEADNGIPDFEQASEKLYRATRWQLVAVPGLIPDDVFFDHLAHRRFPVTTWLREAHESDYLVEPDVFHDFFGHVPLLLNPVFADYLAAYGAKGEEAIRLGGLKPLARLYWYMVEFGLIRTPEGLRAYGAGMLSSASETDYSVTSPVPRRIRFDLRRVLRTDYQIDTFQKTYFVIDSFAELFAASLGDFAPLYAEANALPALAPGATTGSDVLVSP